MKLKINFYASLAFLALTSFAASSQNVNERALWGSICGTENAVTRNYTSTLHKMLLSWRMLPGDNSETSFDLYRKVGNGKEEKLNAEPIFATNFLDLTLEGTEDASYRLTYSGKSEAIGAYTIYENQWKNELPYISIPLASTSDISLPAGYRYEANDASVGDLDGDGRMEIIVKRLLACDENDGTGAGESPKEARHPVIWEAYNLEGKFLWRICSGPNVILGNSSCFAVADYDGDGRAEMAIKTGEGTIFGDGYEIPDTDGDGVTDYRVKGEHYLGKGPEFLSIIDGLTGKELARTDYIPRGKSEDWGDNYFKRASSFRIGVGCFDGKLPSVIIGRGIYERSAIEAWDWRNGKLTRRWSFDTWEDKVGKDGKPYSKYESQGYHSMSVGDVDDDGFDEVVYGSMTVDHDGIGLYTSELGHGDALHLGKFDHSREGLQIFSCFETGKTEVALRDAKDGSIIYAHVADKEGDMGRACVADIDPSSPGCEIWWYRSKLHSISGEEIGDGPESTNMAIWWDGDLNRQTFSGTKVTNYIKGRAFSIHRYDVDYINTTKENPSFYGDILGDWREEIIMPDATKVKDIKIFSTWMPTEHRIPWLMTDHVYAMSALNENIGYNQPTHTGYYLGSDLKNDEEAWENAGINKTPVDNPEDDNKEDNKEDKEPNKEPVPDEPVIDEPVVDEPSVDEPVIDEPTGDEPVIDEPVVDEPTVDDPVVDNPPVVDDPVVDQPVVDDPVVEEPPVDEPVEENPVGDDDGNEIPDPEGGDAEEDDNINNEPSDNPTEDGENGVEGIMADPEEDVIFNLWGERVQNPARGLYIINGKKVIIR